MFSKRSRFSVTSLAIVALLSTSLVSCDPEEDDILIEPEKTGYANDQLLLEHIYNNVDEVVERAFLTGEASLKGGENPLASCASIRVEKPSDSSHIMLIGFGTEPCLGYDGRYRQGTIKVVYTPDVKMTEDGYSHTITFGSYMFDGYRVEGTQILTSKGINSAGQAEYNIYREDKVYIEEDQGYIQGVSTRERVQYLGVGTPQTSDDVYRLTGNGSFNRTNGDKYTVEIAKPLVLANSCNWIREGVINIFPEGATQRVLDYGDGGCEDDATINVNGVITDVKVP